MEKGYKHIETSNRYIQQAPSVSVIIPAYNVAPFIAETIDSVLAQTFTDYEIILINDGSPDTEGLERALAPYLHRIAYLKQDNQGAGAARNAGLRAARGKYVAFLDGDDIWDSSHLREQIALIETGPGYDLVYADAATFGELKSAGYRFSQTNPSSGEATFQSILAGGCCVLTSSVLARRQAIMEVGLFDESLRNSQDFDLWLRLAKRTGTRISYQKTVHVRRRIHAGSLAYESTKSFEGELRVLNKMAQRHDLTSAERETLERTRALRLATLDRIRGKRHLLEGNFTFAARSFESANAYFMSWKLRVILLSLRVAPRLLRCACRRRLG